MDSCHTRTCQAKEADLHVAGTPCVDFSSRGSRQGLAGKTSAALIAWIGQRLRIQEAFIIQENVPSFPTDILQKVLGQVYFIDVVVLDPHAFGWPIARKRKFTLLRHRLKTGAVTQPLNMFCELFLREPPVQFADGRPAWEVFLVATPHELMEELLWAAGRPQASCGRDSQRDGDVEAGPALDPLCDRSDGSFWKVLTPAEQDFLQQYKATTPGQMYQLNQSPKVAHPSDDAKMCTLIKNAGIMWKLGLD